MSLSFWNRFGGFLSGGWHGYGRDRSGVGPSNSSMTRAGTAVTAEGALKISAVWGCINLRSGLVGSLPLHGLDENKRDAKNNPLYNVLRYSPNADMSPSEFWEMMHAGVDLWGNGYAEIVRDGRRVISLEPLLPSGMSHFIDKSGRRIFKYKDGGKEREFESADIFHLKGFTLDGLNGLSALQYASEAVGGLMDANTVAGKLWQQGLKAGGFMQTNQPTLTKEQRDNIREAIHTFSNPRNIGKWMVLEAGFTPVESKGLNISPIDAQLLQSRYFGIEEICRAFETPPQLVGHMDKASSWASSLENVNLGFLVYGLRKRLVRYEQAITKQLVLPEDRASFNPRFAVEGLLRADSASRATFYGAGLRDGWLTRNEVRRKEDLPDLPGGDILTVQAQMVPLDQLGKATLPLPVPAGDAKAQRRGRVFALVGGDYIEIDPTTAGMLADIPQIE